jgi:hypothetical protein
MKVFGNTAMMMGAVALMGWLIVAQQDYQQSFNPSPTAQSTNVDQTSLATSLDRAMIALK